MNQMHNFFGSNGGGFSNLPGPLGKIVNIAQKFSQFVRNPLGALLGLGVDIPQSVGNDPEAMVNYLRNSGRMSNDQFNQFSQWAEPFEKFVSKKP